MSSRCAQGALGIQVADCLNLQSWWGCLGIKCYPTPIKPFGRAQVTLSNGFNSRAHQGFSRLCLALYCFNKCPKHSSAFESTPEGPKCEDWSQSSNLWNFHSSSLVIHVHVASMGGPLTRSIASLQIYFFDLSTYQSILSYCLSQHVNMPLWTINLIFKTKTFYIFLTNLFFSLFAGGGGYEEASTHNQCMVVQGLLLEIFGQLGYTVLCLGLSIYCGGPAVLGVTRYTLVASWVSRVTPGGNGVGEWGSGRLQGSNSGSCVYKYVSLSLELSPRHPFSPTFVF